MSGAPETWAVLGGGMLGQATALRLAQEGRSVTLIERADTLGGLAAPWTVDGLTFDKFYHVILPFDHHLLALLGQIGLKDEIVWKATKTGFYTKGRLVPLNGSVDYLKLPVIGFIDKIRLALLLMFAARIPDGEALDKIAVKDWLIKWCGRSAYENLWLPLLKAKLGANHTKASAAFIWASIRRLYLARKGTGKTEEFGYVRGGYDQIVTTLQNELASRGVDVQSGIGVERVFTSGGQVAVQTDSGTTRFDRVVSTLPAGANAMVFEDLSEQARAKMHDVLYQGVICASVLLNRPLGGYYLTYLTDDDLPFTGIIEMSSLTGTKDGKTLVYLPRYATQDDDYWDLSDDEIESRFVTALRRIYPDLQDNDVAAFRCARARQVMAVPTVGYRENVPPIDAGIPGVHFVNSAQIVDGTLNVDATLGVLDAALPNLLGATEAETTRSAA